MRYTGTKSTMAEWYIDCFLGKYMLKLYMTSVIYSRTKVAELLEYKPIWEWMEKNTFLNHSQEHSPDREGVRKKAITGWMM